MVDTQHFIGDTRHLQMADTTNAVGEDEPPGQGLSWAFFGAGVQRVARACPG